MEVLWDTPSGGCRIRRRCRRPNRAPVISGGGVVVSCSGCIPPPFLLSHSASEGTAARLLHSILAVGRSCLSLTLASYQALSSEEGGFQIPPPLFPSPETEPASLYLLQREDRINMGN